MVGAIFVESRDGVLQQDSARPDLAPRGMSGTAASTGRSDTAAEARRQPGPVLSAGSLFYLTTVGLVAAVIIGVFFGAGFCLLTPLAHGVGSGPRPGEAAPSAYGLLLPFAGDHRTAVVDRVLSPEHDDPALSSAALPAVAEAPAPATKDALPRRTRIGASLAKAVDSAPMQSAATSAAEPSKIRATGLATPTPSLSVAEITELVEHGDALLHTGDVASARLFYERAAAAGDGRAALRLGATFDPAFLGRAGLGKVPADAAEARLWYGRALDLGAAEAKRQLNRLEAKQAQ
jgi:hypothetical protein